MIHTPILELHNRHTCTSFIITCQAQPTYTGAKIASIGVNTYLRTVPIIGCTFIDVWAEICNNTCTLNNVISMIFLPVQVRLSEASRYPVVQEHV